MINVTQIRLMRRRLRILSGLPLAALSVFWTAPVYAVQEPNFVVVKAYDGFEVRDYPALMVAETRADGDMDQAGADGFRRLFRYISGENLGSKKIEMTAPVTEAAVQPANLGDSGHGYAIQFVMPAGSTMESLPASSDPLVQVRALPASRVAVLRYSGRWTEENYREHLALLQNDVAKAGLHAAGPPTLSRYDPPFMPFFWRRNEIWLPLSKDSF